ncbi:MAG: M1 family metallopeptidase [Flavobacteriales bacterium]
MFVRMLQLRHSKSNLLILLVLLLGLASCELFRKQKMEEPVIKLQEKEIPKVYHASKTRKNDLLHTKLEVSLDWSKRELCGKATLSIKPYFYPVKQLELDAKGMIIREIALIDSTGAKKKLTYRYDDKVLNIQLDKEYKRNQEYKIYIDYIAQPEKLLEKKVIEKEDHKGLFFINPDGSNKIKQKEMWSQGEPESNSCWFPTIEATNEKTTQEILFTVDEKMVTLSNGLLISSKSNGDGTRTDHWKHDLPHAPYLVMIAAGDFYVQKDQSGTLPMAYYVEHKDSADALATFGNTPEMIQFFSKKLGVPYPWPKYSQMIVRDFVAGAMENTSAVLHAEYVMRSKRELLDFDHEDHISHELFHHWFGDLVTCESWANLPLNESFANYSEYLWIDYKYGREAADYHYVKDLEGYLMEAQDKQEDLIRYYYSSIDDMFDAHSYNKGGCILHMLRHYVGDDAFFAALKDYLESNKYQSAEIHNLRMSFEKVTGEDLNWFFNQWFLDKGHPVLDISYTYNAASDSLTVNIEQQQDTSAPVFRIPIDIDVYTGAKPKRHTIWLTDRKQSFSFASDGKPEWVSVDADKVLTAQKIEHKSSEEWAFQYAKGKNFIDRYDALAYILQEKTTPAELKKTVVVQALKDPFWANRYYALSELDLKDTVLKGEVMDLVFKMATKDPKSLVRSLAVKQIRANYTLEEADVVLKKSLNDSSYLVVASTMKAYYLMKDKDHKEEALAIIRKQNFPTDEYITTMTIGDIYAEQMDEQYYNFYVQHIPYFENDEQAELVNLFASYLELQNEKTFFAGLDSLYNIATTDEDKVVRKAAVLGMDKLKIRYDKRIKDLERDLADNKQIAKSSVDAKQMQAKLDRLKQEIIKIEAKVAKAVAAEKDKELLEEYKSMGILKQ